jgi:hypothetical protein
VQKLQFVKMKNAPTDKNDASSSKATEVETIDNRLKLLPFEQNLMVENFISDVLFIVARFHLIDLAH